MTLSEYIIRAIARTLPSAARERYSEEWRADLTSSEELGMTAVSIMWGAVVTAVTIDRDAPELTGVTLNAMAARRARWALAAFISAGILGIGLVFWGDYSVQSANFVVGTTLLEIAAFVLKLAAITFVVLGLLGLLAAVRALVTQRTEAGQSLPAEVSTQSLRPSSLMFWLAVAAVFTIGLLIVAPLVVIVVAILATPMVLMISAASRPTRERIPIHASTRLAIGLTTVTVTLSTIAIGVVHILVWNPLAAVPGLSLDAIYAEMAAAGESPSLLLIGVWAAFWSITALAFSIVCLLPRISGTMSARALVTWGLIILALTLSFHWFAGFNMGMSLADTFAISGAGAAASGPALSILGQLCLIAIVWLMLLPQRINAGRLPEQTTRVATN